MTEAEQAAWLKNPTSTFNPAPATANPAAPTQVPAGMAVGFVRTIVGDVNLRQTPGGTVINPAIPYLESLGLFTTERLSHLTSAVVLGAAVAA